MDVEFCKSEQFVWAEHNPPILFFRNICCVKMIGELGKTQFASTIYSKLAKLIIKYLKYKI